jgi:DNA primase
LFKSKNGVKALNYLKDRKISEETIQLFEVGYSLDNWDNFTNFAKSRKHPESDLVLTGLCIESQKENKKNKVYDRFRGRVMFPIKDLLGRIIGFGGRILPNNISANAQENLAVGSSNMKFTGNIKKIKTTNIGDNIAKYINTPETRLYSKSKNIFGIFEAKSHIVEKDYALIVEGYMDAIALFDRGFKNAVASLGTALTSEQIKLISRFTKNIVLVFDGDEAGVNASIKGIDRLKEYNDNLDLFNENNISMKVCILDKGFDPADFVIKKGSEAFLQKIDTAIEMIDFTLETIMSKYNLNELTGKLRASDELLKFISSLSSSIVQEECIKKIASRLKLRESLLLEEMLKKEINRKNNSLSRESRDEEENKNNYSNFLNKNLNPQKRLEIEALSLIINGHDLPKMELLDLPPEYFRFEDTKKLLGIVKKYIIEQNNLKKDINFPIIFSSDIFEDEDILRLYNFIYFSGRNYDDKNKSCIEVAMTLKKLHISDRIEKLSSSISEIEQKMKTDKDPVYQETLDLLEKDLIRLEKEAEYYK